MRKGGHLEQQIGTVLKYLESLGIHGHKNNALRTQDGQYISGEPFDFEVFGHKHFVFDAKECEMRSWNLKSNAKLSQINAMKMCKNYGAEAFFLVYFIQEHKVIMFDVDIIIDAMSKGIRGLTSSEGVVFDWQILKK